MIFGASERAASETSCGLTTDGSVFVIDVLLVQVDSGIGIRVGTFDGMVHHLSSRPGNLVERSITSGANILAFAEVGTYMTLFKHTASARRVISGKEGLRTLSVEPLSSRNGESKSTPSCLTLAL